MYVTYVVLWTSSTWWLRWRPGFDFWVRKIPWRWERQPTTVSLPGESHGQRSLVGYNPWGHKESHMNEWLTLSLLWALSTTLLRNRLFQSYVRVEHMQCQHLFSWKLTMSYIFDTNIILFLLLRIYNSSVSFNFVGFLSLFLFFHRSKQYINVFQRHANLSFV